MKKTFIITILCIALLFANSFCERRCDYTTSAIRGPIQDYFGAFKPGNWWVYQNMDGTKRDSIYVTEYSDEMLRDRTTCLEYEERKFTIKNNWLIIDGEDLTADFESFRDGVGASFSGSFPDFSFYESTNELHVITQYQYPGQQKQIFFDSIVLNNTTYYNILEGKYYNDGDTFYFSKGKGIIGWIRNYESFNLIQCCFDIE